MMSEENFIRLDRLRYTKNTVSSRLALLAILFDVLFFVSIYKSDVGTWYYNILVGASILYNLVFMLVAFLSSEGVKNYQPVYSGVLFVLGVIQIIRIFIYPMRAHGASITIKRVTYAVMEDPQFIRTVIYLTLSAICCFAAAAVNLIKSRALGAHLKALAEGDKEGKQWQA